MRHAAVVSGGGAGFLGTGSSGGGAAAQRLLRTLHAGEQGGSAYLPELSGVEITAHLCSPPWYVTLCGDVSLLFII